MSFFSRALISIWQRKGRTVLFLGLFLIVFSLILSGFAIQKSAEKGKIDARKRIGTEVKLKRDNKKMSKALVQGIQTFSRISPETVDKIKQLPEVKNVQIEGEATALESGLNYVEPQKEQDFGGMLGLGQADKSKEPKFALVGTNNSKGTKDFKNHDAKLIEGEGITEKSPKDAAVVEETFAKNNHLKVGSTFKLKGSSLENKGQERTFKIVGIYKTEKIATGYDQAFVLSQPENQLFLAFDSFSKISDQAGIDEVSFNLKDPLQVESFTKKAEKLLSENEKYFKLDAHTEQYEQMIGPIEKMSAFSSIMIKVILLAGGIILTLLILLSVRERKSEIGILLSLGEEKAKISFQLMTEMFLIAVVAFGLAFTIINVTGESISNSILAKQIDSTENVKTSDDENGAIEDETEVVPVDKIELKLDQDIVVRSSGLGLLLVLITTLIPSIIIARTDPRDLFAQKE
ncbi:ABC transporter permease [Enterococcus caccae]|uniref:Uncharacterized protein n=1 Tax=Enterococcus caccae ATCC BAA-1240 TaxID=1158612 RepID=R3TU60_9ENTE|nr:ABC transporter permease [Enterococcus caccae]EOL45104.1 hypothetical protein UC7_01910 [Enterococcus caccae ATCC BAA-1240]EOT58511.1 hypothetical protein I580_02682 [Enterococcus caccae ATCC BAA-1240]